MLAARSRTAAGCDLGVNIYSIEMFGCAHIGQFSSLRVSQVTENLLCMDGYATQNTQVQGECGAVFVRLAKIVHTQWPCQQTARVVLWQQ